MPSTQALQAFEAAARLSSFQDAADELAVTPSAISHRIRQFEDYCGQQTFVREARRIRLSAFGHQILPSVLRVLEDMRALRPTPPEAGPLRIHAPPLFYSAIVHPALASLGRAVPDTCFEFHVGVAGSTLRGAAAAITYGPRSPPDWPQVRLLRSHNVMVCGAGDGLGAAALTDPSRRLPMIRYAYAPHAWRRFAPNGGDGETASILVSSMPEAVALAKAGRGLALVIEELVRGELERGELVEIPGSRRRARTFYFAYNPAFEADSRLRSLGDWLARQCART